MSFYKYFASRDRNKYGEVIKKKFAKIIFDLSVTHGAKESILEIGPGDGYVADIALAKGLRYSAIEGSSSIVAKLAERNIDVQCAFVPPLPPMDKLVDCCILLHVLEHMDNHVKASELLGNIHAGLKSDGLVIIAVPDYLSWGKLFFDCDYTHAYPLTKRRLNRLLEDNGFNIVLSEHYSGCFIGKLPYMVSRVLSVFYSETINSLFFGKSDLLYRGVLTFMPNLLVVARKV